MAPQVIAGRYRLEERLGAGGMGVVWRATDLELRRTVALKRSLDGDTGQIRREARLGASLHHPHVVAVFDSVADGDDQWLVMEYLPARSLEEVVRADGVLAPERAAALGAQIASALVAMHARDMVHRDITPGNVLLAEDGTAKLADLGISRWAEVTLTGSASVGGTAGYLAPEVANGYAAGPAADVFSLGATLFAAVEGVSPWGSGENGPFGQLRRAAEGKPETPRHAGPLAFALTLMLDRHPANRPTAAEVEGLLSGDPDTQPLPRRRPRSRKLKFAAAGVLGAVVLLVAGLLVFTRNEPTAAKATSDLVGDPRTADPCSLLTVNSLAPYGKVFLEPNLGTFARCDLDTTLPGDGGTIVTSLELTAPEEYPQVPPVRGRLGEIQRPNADPGKCRRYFVLPDLRLVTVSSVRADGEDAPQLCAMSDAVVGDAYARVVGGPIARRAQPFPSASLALVDACSLVDDATLRRVAGPGYPTDRYFANWACSWGEDAESVDLYYDRQWPLATDPPDGQTRVVVGGRTAYVDPHDDDGDVCDVTVVYRTYTPVLPTVKGTPAQRDEVVLVEYTDDAHQGDLDAICATAKSIAAVVAQRLPAS
ncbi:serine/threonine-protein kinase [Amycolatopsis rhabdoformis]|uniref:Serine/threonine-protein kinase n=1 Tax=Amycolatopsis rhabdoformis TaxID=1448059 RepID=A0ABZ1IK25_9PSEU|nr:serine/threonine-protein kinase [Amycolatopsis rhabdoformis]WSE34642.1 serine/threonine-protein kinase [Amycolatopsis rhabdoformis]